jgi:hypothetical protein
MSTYSKFCSDMQKKTAKFSLNYYEYTLNRRREHCSWIWALDGAHAVKVKERIKV